MASALQPQSIPCPMPVPTHPAPAHLSTRTWYCSLHAAVNGAAATVNPNPIPTHPAPCTPVHAHMLQQSCWRAMEAHCLCDAADGQCCSQQCTSHQQPQQRLACAGPPLPAGPSSFHQRCAGEGHEAAAGNALSLLNNDRGQEQPMHL